MPSPNYAYVKVIDADGNFLEDVNFETKLYDEVLTDSKVEYVKMTESEYESLIADDKSFYDKFAYYVLISNTWSKKLINNWNKLDDYMKNLNIIVSKDGYKTGKINAYFDGENGSFYYVLKLEKE